ncbi:MAG: sugar ABC transporter ATP-binding protein [Ktedonobacteraceae bacterium]|nr:sugar ABC transporter ATP-binding protein [Ktedonobacteraceae bacterium]
MAKISLAVRHLVKRYEGVTALSDGNLEVQSGEVLALVGANGSGKSTLSKIIAGAVAPDEGQLLLNNQEIRFSSPQAARKSGIVEVYQELSLVPDMTVAENIWLAHEPLVPPGLVRGRQVRAHTEQLLALFEGTYSAALRPDALVSTLSPDEKQLVEILKALSLQPKLLLLDEPTASLDARQVSRLFELIADWKAQDMAIIFISHRMEEIFRIADRVTVLRSGRTVGSARIQEISEHDLVDMMVESSVVSRIFKREETREEGSVRLAIRDLRTQTLRGVSLVLRDGELVGLGGLRGQGQSDVLLACFGAIPFTGTIELAGRAVHFTHPQQAMCEGIAFVPGDRTTQGLLPIRSILENLQLPSWLRYGLPLRMQRAREDARVVAQRLNMVMASLDAPVSSLSGGNAQKVVLGKWLLRQPKVLLLDDPTKGVDVGAKGEFYRILADLRVAGATILLYSSDDEELLGLCDRVIVLRDGLVQAELAGDSLTRSDLVASSMGAARKGAV